MKWRPAQRVTAAIVAVFVMLGVSILPAQANIGTPPSNTTAVRVDCTNVRVTYAGATSSTSLRVNLIWGDQSVFYQGPGSADVAEWSHTFGGLPATSIDLTVWVMNTAFDTLSKQSIPLVACGQAVDVKVGAPDCKSGKVTFPWTVANTGSSAVALELRLNGVPVVSSNVANGQKAAGLILTDLKEREPYTVSAWVDGVTYGDLATGYAVSCTVIRPVKPPVVTGSYKVGTVLRVSKGVWTVTPTSYRYRWYRYDNKAGARTIIKGATKSTYRIKASDRGYDITGLTKPVRKGFTSHFSGPGASPVR